MGRPCWLYAYWFYLQLQLSKYSDIDLHIVVDFKEVDERTEFVKEYFDSKKNQWNDEHEGISIYGFPVELYVEDINDNTTSGGKYDLEKNEWINEPNPNDIQEIGLDKFEIKHKAAQIMTQIDDLYDAANDTSDTEELNSISDEAEELIDTILDIRKTGLERGGEGDMGNIIYKVLRRTGYFDKLWELISNIYDEVNSITESVKKHINEEVVADGNAEHNPYAKRWKQERDTLKNFIINNGVLMTSKENGKLYKVYLVNELTNLIGYNYALCLEYDPYTMDIGSTVYIRAFDKFTRKIFRPEFDARGRDNMGGTADDLRMY